MRRKQLGLRKPRLNSLLTRNPSPSLSIALNNLVIRFSCSRRLRMEGATAAFADVVIRLVRCCLGGDFGMCTVIISGVLL